jgi:hypothetical protein
MEVQRLGVKIFAASASLQLGDFIPVFHTWIQKQIIKDHLLIDVHDYRHIVGGPGVLLVAHEGNFSMDTADDRLGVFYYRKQPTTGAPETRFASIVKTALDAARLLEDDPALSGRIRFRTDEMLIVANDRLAAPNDPATFETLQRVVSAGLKQALGDVAVKMELASTDSRERLSIRAITSALQHQR